MSTISRTVLFATIAAQLAGCGIIEVVPLVSITSPTEDESVSGMVMVTADATALVSAVASVDFELPNGTSVTDRDEPFEVEWDSTSVTDGSYTLRVTATDERGLFATTETSFTVANERPAPQDDCEQQTFRASGLPRGIPDFDADGLRSTIQTTGSGSVNGLALSLSLTHPLSDDVAVKLVSPTGERTNISIHNTQAQNGAITITNRNTHMYDGQAMDGLWTLIVQDSAPSDVGRLNAWSLTIGTGCPSGAE